MQIFIAINDEKAGPFTPFQVEERLRSGELKEDQLGWYHGLEEWRPLRELAPFESFFRLRDAELEEERQRQTAEQAAAFKQRRAEALPASAVRPWTRFWARNLDFFFFLTACLVAFSALRQLGWVKAPTGEFLNYFPLFLPIWHLMEAYMISRWGSTPGKALVGIHVTDSESNRLGFRASLRRSLGVYVLGVGCYLAGFSLIASIFGYYTLSKNKRCFWDLSAESFVQHTPLQARHVILPLAIIFLLLTLFQGPFGELADQQAEDIEKLRGIFRSESSEPL